MNKSRQTGFTLVETLLVLLFLAIIGFTGYYVWHAQKNATTTLDAANKSSSSTASSNSAITKPKTSDLIISEWNITIPNGTADVFSYSLKGVYAQLSTQKLSTLDPDCSASKGGAIGIIQRASANDVVYEDGTTAAAAFKQNPQTIAHIGNYYYVYNSPQAGCSNTSSTNDVQTSAIQEIRPLVPLAQASN